MVTQRPAVTVQSLVTLKYSSGFESVTYGLLIGIRKSENCIQKFNVLAYTEGKLLTLY